MHCKIFLLLLWQLYDFGFWRIMELKGNSNDILTTPFLLQKYPVNFVSSSKATVIYFRHHDSSFDRRIFPV